MDRATGHGPRTRWSLSGKSGSRSVLRVSAGTLLPGRGGVKRAERQGQAGVDPGREPYGGIRHHHQLDPGSRPDRRDARQAPPLQRQFPIEATKDNVPPPMTGASSASTPTWPGAPCWSPARPRGSTKAWGAVRRLCPEPENKSDTITAEIEVGDRPANGVIMAQGGAFGGWVPLRQRRNPEVLVQPARPRALLRHRGCPADAETHHQRLLPVGH
jgi:hypothetical protein